MKYLLPALAAITAAIAVFGVAGCAEPGEIDELMTKPQTSQVVYFDYPEEEWQSIAQDENNPDYMIVWRKGDTVHMAFEQISEEEKNMYPYHLKADSACGTAQRYTDTWVEIASGD